MPDSTTGDRMVQLKRMLAYYESGTTDQADEPFRVKASTYVDADRWQLEIDRIWKRCPLPLALSIELREPNAYKAMDAVGVPVLITRGADGVARAFLNVCRHRGAIVCEPGCGTGRRFTCPYHAWVYDQQGALAGVYGEDTFGPFDRDERGLVALPCDERAGFVFVTLDPTGSIDLDEWLGDYQAELETLELDTWHVFQQRELESGAWKVAYDGYLEGYHFASLHKNTLFAEIMSNLMGFDAYGPHQRVMFARQALQKLREVPEDQWVPEHFIGPVHTIFPSVSIAGQWGSQALVSQLFPGPTPDRSRTIQTTITRHPIETEEQRVAAQQSADFLYAVVKDEDYTTGFGITHAMSSGANDELIFGRNEKSLHTFHQWVERLIST